MHAFPNRHARMLAAALLLAAMGAPAAAADVVTTAPTATPAVTTDGQSKVQARYVGEFSVFAGSEDNAQSLYSGLRNGTRITLTEPWTGSNGSSGTTVVQFDPPTRPMGNGNVTIATALAREQLAGYGITEPTPQQLQAALTGGAIQPADSTASPVMLKGVLVQRADGMGWGNIARASGTNLGSVVSGLRSSRGDRLASAGGLSESGTTSGTASGMVSSRGLTTAAGGSGTPRAGITKADAMRSAGHGRSSYTPSRGIVTAGGSPVAVGGLSMQGGARAGHAGNGFAATGGVSASGRSTANSQGQGKGLIRH